MAIRKNITLIRRDKKVKEPAEVASKNKTGKSVDFFQKNEPEKVEVAFMARNKRSEKLSPSVAPLLQRRSNFRYCILVGRA